MGKTNSVQKKFNLTESMCSQIKELALEQGISETQVVENAFSQYYRQEVMPEHIVLGRMTQLQQQLDVMDRKLETLAGLVYSTLPYFMAVLPPLPESITDKDGNRRNPQLQRGMQVFEAHIKRYRHDMKTMKISFMQNVWADMQEDLNMTQINAAGMARDERRAGD
ncbi:hypothetical protein [uncultured Treponema sp.]|uniref:hypothetical protein n=1 Tax=uncultured Treponema sp. TaxID=162155 RepID=UPI0026360B82|nr:hypothetical protein [uncultured Treponema sp.]